MKAIAMLDGDANVSGVITLTQAHESSPVLVQGEIAGLTAGEHGLTVHESGDLGNGLTSVGPHFNPHGRRHGAPSDEDRHAGDLGNIRAPESGAAVFKFLDGQVTLFGPHSVMGRTIVVYANEDDLGKGSHELSRTTGNAGRPLAGGVIVMTQE